MKIINRYRSCINPNETLELIENIPNFPITANSVDSLRWDEDLTHDMKWGISQSGHIELMELVDPNLIYKHYHNPGTIGKTWKTHHETFYEFIKKDYFFNVLEIGGSNGRLVDNFCLHSTKFNWSIIEPSTQNAPTDRRIELIEGYFEKHDFNNQYDTIVHSHVFEHIYDPIPFLNKVYSLLRPNGLHYISIPNMKHWLDNGYTNTLFFEHTFYVDEYVIEYLLDQTGFEIIDKKVSDHSIFIRSKKTNTFSKKVIDFSYIKNLFNKFMINTKKDTENIKTELGDSKFYIFGGHIFSQMLFNLGLDQRNVICILDNDPHKHYKRLYGTYCLIKPTSVLQNDKQPIVVLRGGAYSNEIKKSILTINPNAIIL